MSFPKYQTKELLNKVLNDGEDALKVDIDNVTLDGSQLSVDIDKENDSIVIYSNTAKDGSGTNYVPLVDSDGHLQVDVLTSSSYANAIDSNNSTTSALGSGATFTGTGTDVSAYTSVTITLSTDQDSAADGMKFQFSSDNSNWDDSYSFAYDVSVNGTARRFQFPVTARYFRVVYTNGGTGQGHFRVQTILHRNNVITSIHRIDGTLYGDRSATLTKSVIAGETSAGGGGTFVNVKVNPSGSLETVANQDTHDDLNANANIQVANSDVADGNPVPVSDAGGSLTVDGTVSSPTNSATVTGQSSSSTSYAALTGSNLTTDNQGLFSYEIRITGTDNCTLKVQGSNDNSNWVDDDMDEVTIATGASGLISGTSFFKYIRLQFKSSATNGTTVNGQGFAK